MRCEHCRGTGVDPSTTGFILPHSCPDCNGSGIAHCCDGIREQPTQCANGHTKPVDHCPLCELAFADPPQRPMISASHWGMFQT